jgi:tetratricopeptide (TPR) repeat protein
MDYYDPMFSFNRLPLLVIMACALSANVQASDEKAAEPVSSALDGALFYQLLLGELNAQNSEPGTGFSLILDTARKTNDPRLFQRAVDIALQARSGDSALQAARAWKQALPNSKEANRYIFQILIGLNRISEAQEPLKREIANTPPADRAGFIAAIPRYFARASDKKLAASTVERALQSYLSATSIGVTAWSVIGRMRFEAGDSGAALEAARKAQALDRKASSPALLALALMSPKLPQAEALVKNYLENQAHPEVRMDYARALLDAQRYADAAAQLQTITEEKPDYPQAWLIRGMLELQEGQAFIAERYLTRYIDLALAIRPESTDTEPDPGLTRAYTSLAQIAEQLKDFVQADAWLQRIDNKADLLSAQLRRAGLLARQGKYAQARELIHSQPAKSPADVRLKTAAEVQLLRDSKQYQAAYALLADTTARHPEDWDFVYDMAMVAEKLGQPEEMERLLRSVIASKPEYLHAYNALGYSLAERNTRLPEAKQLILKALEYAPGDPFISDSLGWVEFRSGNLTEAHRILQEAFKIRPDAEIAAHLGEVLWHLGHRDQAARIWQQGLQLSAENETLQETLNRLKVKLRANE